MSITVLQFLKRGEATSKQIQVATGLSQAVVSRHLTNLADSVIKLDQQRPPVYLLTREAFGAGDRLPIIMTDTYGKNCVVGCLRPIEPKGFYFQGNQNTPLPLLGCENEMFSDLPYYLDDLRPQGFLGRQIALKLSDYFPTNLAFWNANQIGRYLIANGEDLTGNITLGEQGLLRLRRKPKTVSHKEYANIATEVLNGENFGSSAGGEQPKFTAFNDELQKHVIVKFSPIGESDIARRWRDVLISEHYACMALNKYNIAAAQTQLVERAGRLFLQSVRFDRHGMFGKSSMISLLSIDSEFVGSGESWYRTCSELVEQKLLDKNDLGKVKMLSAFGQLINNTDMHLGNLSLSIENNIFKLLPVYDMCCMGFAPKSSEVMPFKFSMPNIDSLEINSEQTTIVKKTVGYFWQKLSQDAMVSDGFKDYLLSN